MIQQCLSVANNYLDLAIIKPKTTLGKSANADAAATTTATMKIMAMMTTARRKGEGKKDQDFNNFTIHHPTKRDAVWQE